MKFFSLFAALLLLGCLPLPVRADWSAGSRNRYAGVFVAQPGRRAVSASLTIVSRQGQLFRAVLVLGNSQVFSGTGRVLPGGSFVIDECLGTLCYRMRGRSSQDGSMLAGSFAGLYNGLLGDVFGSFQFAAQ